MRHFLKSVATISALSIIACTPILLSAKPARAIGSTLLAQVNENMMPLVKLVQILYQFLLTPIALELAFCSPVNKLVLILISVNPPINTITVNTNSAKQNC
jgi:hypothetical protein